MTARILERKPSEPSGAPGWKVAALTLENLAEAVQTYQTLRTATCKAARANSGAAMGEHAWLRNSLLETDIEMEITPDGQVACHGTTRSGQTQDCEDFEFTIPLDDVLGFMPVDPATVGCLDDPEATVMGGICHHPGDRHPVGQPRTTVPEPAPAPAPPQGVPLAWINDGIGYRCPQCHLFVAIPKRDGSVCPRCKPETATEATA